MDAADCVASRYDYLAVVWNGAASDRVQLFAKNFFSMPVCEFSNPVLMTNPTALDFRPNGNLVIADATSNLLIEVDRTCGLVGVINSNAIAAPNDLLVLE
jgi:hypothetical protein